MHRPNVQNSDESGQQLFDILSRLFFPSLSFYFLYYKATHIHTHTHYSFGCCSALIFEHAIILSNSWKLLQPIIWVSSMARKKGINNIKKKNLAIFRVDIFTLARSMDSLVSFFQQQQQKSINHILLIFHFVLGVSRDILYNY